MAINKIILLSPGDTFTHRPQIDWPRERFSLSGQLIDLGKRGKCYEHERGNKLLADPLC